MSQILLAAPPINIMFSLSKDEVDAFINEWKLHIQLGTRRKTGFWLVGDFRFVPRGRLSRLLTQLVCAICSYTGKWSIIKYNSLNTCMLFVAFVNFSSGVASCARMEKPSPVWCCYSTAISSSHQTFLLQCSGQKESEDKRILPDRPTWQTSTAEWIAIMPRSGT